MVLVPSHMGTAHVQAYGGEVFEAQKHLRVLYPPSPCCFLLFPAELLPLRGLLVDVLALLQPAQTANSFYLKSSVSRDPGAQIMSQNMLFTKYQSCGS